MSKFTRLYLRTPRPQSLFGLVGLQTGTELISLALVLNKVTGVYGLLAILTGYQLSLLQLSTYVYSIAVLGILIYLIPHIRRQSPFECLALAWIYLVDTVVNGACTAVLGLEWYFASTAAELAESGPPPSLPSIVTEGLEGLRREGEVHGKVVPQETITSMLLVVSLTLIRVYFSIVVMAFARQVLRRHMQLRIVQGPEVDADGDEGPFAAHQPNGSGRRGRLGRFMVSIGRGYWLDGSEMDGNWQRAPHVKGHVEGTLAGEV
ncbi:hypothetical protein CDD82_7114 [Ophiocordyceps australis]|uniref:DUF1753 domain-containing protein n=1 Tax=Ophiocordyceps australis TaxID=1399860 RepID=A0A2C5ZUP3_9HYPO|nr:hypothetical protein CDD82_7114 [Ophiocordyceps australis]